MYEYKATVSRVIDGDTFEADVDLGFHTIHRKEKFRMSRINAPEMDTAEGKEAKAFLANLIEGKEIILTSQKQEKFGRYLAEVAVSGESINDLLVNTGHATTYP